MISNPAPDPKNHPKIRIRDSENPDPEQHCNTVVLPVFLSRKARLVFLDVIYFHLNFL